MGEAGTARAGKWAKRGKKRGKIDKTGESWPKNHLFSKFSTFKLGNGWKEGILSQKWHIFPYFCFIFTWRGGGKSEIPPLNFISEYFSMYSVRWCELDILFPIDKFAFRIRWPKQCKYSLICKSDYRFLCTIRTKSDINHEKKIFFIFFHIILCLLQRS